MGRDIHPFLRPDAGAGDVRGVQPAVHQPLRRALATLGLIACAFAAGACGDSGDRPERAKLPATLPADFNLQLFDCADWNRADAGARAYVLRRLHTIANDQVTGPGVQGRGSVLTDEQATRLFDTRCRSNRARGFVLYKLYAYARGFIGRGPSQP